MEQQGIERITAYFADVELTEDYEPYFCSVEDAATISALLVLADGKIIAVAHYFVFRHKEALLGALAAFLGGKVAKPHHNIGEAALF